MPRIGKQGDVRSGESDCGCVEAAARWRAGAGGQFVDVAEPTGGVCETGTRESEEAVRGFAAEDARPAARRRQRVRRDPQDPGPALPGSAGRLPRLADGL